MRVILAGWGLCCLLSCFPGGVPESGVPGTEIVHASDASSRVVLAARELQRYLHLRTGTFVPVVTTSSSERRILLERDGELSEQQYRLRTREGVLTLSGGSDTAVLYAAYHLVEKLGVRFHLHGDVIPDERIPWTLPRLDETHRPAFHLRGLLPFHDFPEGPDWWDVDDYKAFFDQMAKMRMNFIGLHSYPGRMAEPHLWIGIPGDCRPDGTVVSAHPSGYASTARDGMWGYGAMKTGEFAAGASQVFPKEHHGSDIHGDFLPFPETPEENVALFNHAGRKLQDAFAHGRRLGIRLCIGNELPLWFPAGVVKRLKESGVEPFSDEGVRLVFRGIFKRLNILYRPDYYWLWTPEGWVLQHADRRGVDLSMKQIGIAAKALAEEMPDCRLATCGWTIGPPGDPSGFDRVLPSDGIVSSINRNIGFAPVASEFAGMKHRETWAIPWIEDDPAMVDPQLWTGRTLRDACDAKRYGVDGLFGIHWRTRILSPMFRALAEAGWNPPSEPAGSSGEASAPTDFSDGGKTVTVEGEVGGTELDDLYRSVRYDMKGYDIRLPNGTYRVTLHFCETRFEEDGKRVFDVDLQGKNVIEGLDIHSRSGRMKALDLSFDGIRVEEGRLLVDFRRRTGHPVISGIAVEGKSDSEGRFLSRKINCGGHKVNPYRRDLEKEDALASARAWDLPVKEFYADWVSSQFGPDAPPALADLFARLDGGPRACVRELWEARLPRVSSWGGPGALVPDPVPWRIRSRAFAFVEEMEEMLPAITSPGARERFLYWLNMFRCQREMARAESLSGELGALVSVIRREKTPERRRERAEKEALPVRLSLARCWETLLTLQLQTLTNASELGTIANLETHSRKSIRLVDRFDAELEGLLGRGLPAGAELSKAYRGEPVITVLSRRTLAKPGERVGLKVVILDRRPPVSARLHWRKLGEAVYESVDLKHVGRAVYGVDLPLFDGPETIEYHIEARTASERRLFWPPTAPSLNHTLLYH